MKTLVFLKEFLNRKSPFGCFSEISFRGSDVLGSEVDKRVHLNSSLLIKDVPGYLDLKGHGSKNLKIKSQKGYFADLSKFNDFQEYLENVQGPKSRSNLRRYLNRLETCFPIRYSIYYGFIEKDEYERVFSTLRALLEKRFAEKKERNYELPYLPEIQKDVYDLILQRKASIFVIYDGNKPISIRINMFKNRLAYYIISGYDIDYSKFHLGYIDMARNLEWLFENHFEIYDLLKGYEAYKSKWFTDSYYNKHFIVLKNNTLYSLLEGILGYLRLSLRERILSLIRFLKLNTVGKQILKSLKPRHNKKTVIAVTEIPESELDALQGKMIEINIEAQEEFNYLRKFVYDFQFNTKSVYHKTRIFKHPDLPVFRILNGNDQTFIKVK